MCTIHDCVFTIELYNETDQVLIGILAMYHVQCTSIRESVDSLCGDDMDEPIA